MQRHVDIRGVWRRTKLVVLLAGLGLAVLAVVRAEGDLDAPTLLRPGQHVALNYRSPSDKSSATPQRPRPGQRRLAELIGSVGAYYERTGTSAESGTGISGTDREARSEPGIEAEHAARILADVQETLESVDLQLSAACDFGTAPNAASVCPIDPDAHASLVDLLQIVSELDVAPGDESK